jgi:hypothetical protein
MDLDLKNNEWKELTLENLFEIKGTKSGIDRNKLIKKVGHIPYLTRTDRNNGLDSFICEQEDKYQKDGPNVITIGLDTQTVFYQSTEFYTGQNVQILKNKFLTKKIAHFLIPLIKRQIKKFNWGGNGATLTGLRRSKILLPINKKGEPDYEFMENYMREKEQELLKRYRNYSSSKNNKVEQVVKPLNKVEWGEFEIEKLFVLSTGKSKGLNHLQQNKNGVNYLGATNLNNGVLCKVEKKEDLIHLGNAIAFIRNGEGSMGYSIYKKELFIATSDITVGYNPFLNRYIGTFITTVADKVRGKYNFGYKRSTRRLKKEKILLPITSNGKPDYEYMESYMRKMEYDKLYRYIEKRLKQYID